MNEEEIETVRKYIEDTAREMKALTTVKGESVWSGKSLSILSELIPHSNRQLAFQIKFHQGRIYMEPADLPTEAAVHALENKN